MTKIIGIYGPSNAGKSRLAIKIRNHLSDAVVKVLHQDEFVKPEDKLPIIQDHIDWEMPESIDWDKLIQAIHRLKDQCDLLIVEGIFALHFKELLKLYDAVIVMTLSKEVFLERKSNDERWGIEPNWYREHIWDSHLKYRPGKIAASSIFYVDAEKDVEMEGLLAFISG